MSKYHDDTTKASDPGRVTLSPRRLASFRPHESLWQRARRRLSGDRFAELLDEHLRWGDSRAAVVVRISPLLIAAYTDELDCVAMLCFSPRVAEQFTLKTETRLLTVNTYERRSAIVHDLVPGDGAHGRYQNFYPLIAEFLSDDSERMTRRKAEIAELEWERCASLGFEYVRLRPNVARDGSPFASARPAGPANKW